MMIKVIPLDAGAEAPFQLAEDVYALTAAGSICYLVKGTDCALVIDTGFGKVDVYENARKVTNLPLKLFNTHAHGDHIGCNEKFTDVYANALETQKLSRKNNKFTAVEEGFVFDLGARKLEVLALPGHTPGGIGLLDRENRIVFTGDMIGDRPLFLQFPYSSLRDYIASMDKLLALSDEIDYVFCCHGSTPLTLAQAVKTRVLAQMILNGECDGKPVHLDTEDGCFDVNVYSHDGAAIYYA